MTIDDVYNLWDRHAYADEDRRTEIANLTDIVRELGRDAPHPCTISRDKWDNIIDDLHREHSTVDPCDLAEYLEWVANGESPI